MSLILDALRKSEQERQAQQENQQQTSLALAARTEPAAQSRPIFTYLLIIIFTCLITLALTYQFLLKTNTNGGNGADEQQLNVSSHEPAKHTEEKIFTLHQPARHTAINPPQKTSSKPITLVTPLLPTRAAAPEVRQTAPAASPNPNSAPDNKTAAASKQSSVTQSAATNSPGKVQAHTELSESESESESTFLHAVPHLKDMPQALQKQIPSLDYASHWYDKNAGQRNLIINNRSLHEGEWINTQLMLKSIKPNGAVFEFNKQTFHLPLLESWPQQ